MLLNKKITLALCLLLFTGSVYAQEKKDKDATKDSLRFTVIKENPITSVKNQNRSGTCWAFSSLGFFEAELLRTTKKEYDLCEAYLVEKTYLDRAKAAVRTHGDISFSQGGSFYDAVYCIKNYGICPEDAMPKPGSLCPPRSASPRQLLGVFSPLGAGCCLSLRRAVFCRAC